MGNIRTLLDIYKDEPIMTRLHIVIRAAFCPFLAILSHIPREGSVLDIGCGHGLLLNLLRNDPEARARKLVGIDHDSAKIGVASRAKIGEMEFLNKDLGDLGDEKFDTISIVDVLYTIDLNKWDGFLAKCFALLKPNGKLIIKEAVNRPLWKYLFTIFQEKLAVGIFKITHGDRPHMESVNTYCCALKIAGFAVERFELLKNWYPYSHCIFIANKNK